MKTLAQLKRMKKVDLKTYAVENFDITMMELESMTNPEIIIEIQDAIKDQAAEAENAKLDKLEEVEESNGIEAEILSEESEYSSIYDEEVDCEATDEHWEEIVVSEPEIKETIKIEEKENMESEFEVPEMKENFVIGSRDARLQIGSLKKASPAREAVEAVSAIKEEKDEDGNITQEAVAAVKAIPAKPATLAVQKVFLIARTDEIADEVVARMADHGFLPAEGSVREYVDGDCPRLTYTDETDKPIRAAFKVCKSKDGYNAPGLALAKEKAKEEEKARKAAEKAAVEKEKEEESTDLTEGPVDDLEVPVEESGTEEWPGESFDA